MRYVRWKTVTARKLPHAYASNRARRGRHVQALQERPLAKAENHLFEILPRADRLRLLACCETVDLVLSEVLCERGALIEHVYFPVQGFISLLTQVDHHASLEVGLVGREGMFGAELALGMLQSPLRALVQGSGSARRVGSASFRRELTRSTALREVLQRYLRVVLVQMASSAACLRFHLIQQRLARWLLMSADRAHAVQFHVTHEFLASMLGVRRVGITVAASTLQRDGLITYRRGEVTVLDRKGLEAVACSCYASEKRAYTTALG